MSVAPGYDPMVIESAPEQYHIGFGPEAPQPEEESCSLHSSEDAPPHAAAVASPMPPGTPCRGRPFAPPLLTIARLPALRLDQR